MDYLQVEGSDLQIESSQRDNPILMRLICRLPEYFTAASLPSLDCLALNFPTWSQRPIELVLEARNT